MKTSIWTYPWDVVDRGVDRAVGEIAETGVSAVSLAATYHCFDQLRPRGDGGRLLTVDRSAAYYPCDPDAFAGGPLVPHRSELVGGDRWSACAEAAHSAGLDVVAWTLFLHNSWLAGSHPALAQQTCTGDALRHQLCPAQPDVRAYALALAADVSRHVDVLECESLSYGAWGHAHYHPKIGVDLGTGGRFLFSLCFCDACRGNAREENVDADGLAERVSVRVLRALEAGTPIHDDPDDLVADDEALAAFLAVRERTVTSLVSDVVTAAGKPVRFLAMGDRPTSAVDVSSLHTVEAVEYLCYTPDTDRIARTLSGAAAEVGDVRRVCAGLQAYPPASPDADSLGAAVHAARRAGVGFASFYNYGIMPEPNLAWIRQALAG